MFIVILCCGFKWIFPIFSLRSGCMCISSYRSWSGWNTGIGTFKCIVHVIYTNEFLPSESLSVATVRDDVAPMFLLQEVEYFYSLVQIFFLVPWNINQYCFVTQFWEYFFHIRYLATAFNLIFWFERNGDLQLCRVSMEEMLSFSLK